MNIFIIYHLKIYFFVGHEGTQVVPSKKLGEIQVKQEIVEVEQVAHGTSQLTHLFVIGSANFELSKQMQISPDKTNPLAVSQVVHFVLNKKKYI
jgi:hypothetical protein